jgi:hypothetical protein
MRIILGPKLNGHVRIIMAGDSKLLCLNSDAEGFFVVTTTGYFLQQT